MQFPLQGYQENKKGKRKTKIAFNFIFSQKLNFPNGATYGGTALRKGNFISVKISINIQLSRFNHNLWILLDIFMATTHPFSRSIKLIIGRVFDRFIFFRIFRRQTGEGIGIIGIKFFVCQNNKFTHFFGFIDHRMF